ncbi:MAG: hypothetical protein ACRCUT_08100, partial [Spirochaetota bacterium]
MRLIQCIISKNSLFRNKTISFDREITAIYGPNDSGKTFLARAVIDCAASGFAGRSLISSEDWETMHMKVEYDNCGLHCTSSRTGHAPFSLADEHGAVLMTQNGSEAPVVSPYFQTLPGFRALSRFSLEGLLNAGFISSPLDGGAAIDHAVLKKILLDDSSGFFRLGITLKDSFCPHTLARGCSAVHDEILEHEDEIRQIEKQSQLFQMRQAKQQKMRDEKRQLSAAKKKLDERIRDISDYRSDVMSICGTREYIDRCSSDIEQIQRETDIERERIAAATAVRNNLTKIFPKFVQFTEIHRENLEKIKETYREIRDVRSELDQLDSSSSKAAEKTSLFAAVSGIISAAGAAALFIPTSGHFSLRIRIVTAAAALAAGAAVSSA